MAEFEPIVIGLAELIVSDIFNAARTSDDTCQRIQLKGGTDPSNETDLGGFNKSALTSFIAKSIDKNLRGPS